MNDCTTMLMAVVSFGLFVLAQIVYFIIGVKVEKEEDSDDETYW